MGCGMRVWGGYGGMEEWWDGGIGEDGYGIMVKGEVVKTWSSRKQSKYVCCILYIYLVYMANMYIAIRHKKKTARARSATVRSKNTNKKKERTIDSEVQN